MLSPLLFATVVDVINEKARGVVDELMYADDLVLMSEIMEDLKKRFFFYFKMQHFFYVKCLKNNL